MLKKTYKPIIIWSFLVLAVSVAPSLLLKTPDPRALTALTDLVIALSITGLMYYIYKKEYVYYYNGISYEKALAAGSERRRAYRLSLFRLFSFATLTLAIISAVMENYGANVWAQLGAFVTVFTGAAVWSIRYKL